MVCLQGSETSHHVVAVPVIYPPDIIRCFPPGQPTIVTYLAATHWFGPIR